MSLKTLVSEGFRRFHHPRGDRAKAGWATESLEEAARTAVLAGMAAWQAILVVVTLGSLDWGIRAALLVAGAYALFLLDLSQVSTTGSVLLFTSWWMVELANAYVIEGRWWRLPPLAALACVPATMLLARPEWSGFIALSFVMFIVAKVPGIRIGFSFIIDYTHDADARTAELAAATADLASRRAAISQVAEDSRRLHDTAINTLAAVANGGAALQDQAAVRDRCLADVEVMSTVRTDALADELERESLRNAVSRSASASGMRGWPTRMWRSWSSTSPRRSSAPCDERWRRPCRTQPSIRGARRLWSASDATSTRWSSRCATMAAAPAAHPGRAAE